MVSLQPVQRAVGAAQQRVGFATGAGLQAVNLAVGKFVGTMKDADLIVMSRPSLTAGADAVASRFRPMPVAADYDTVRDQRPLLATTTVTTPGIDSPAVLQFDATAPGTDFAKANAETAPVSVYVDGRYHSDVMVMSERPRTYGVNLAGLDGGSHAVELRASRDIAPPEAGVPQVSNVVSRVLSGDEALAARYAPMIETRNNVRADRSRPEGTFTDIPLAMAPNVQHLPDGTTRVAYDLLSSNEDGGTPVTSTFRRFGRSTDYEPVASVLIGADGVAQQPRFQGPMHVPYGFVGARVGDRPVLRIGTRNGLFTSRSEGATPRWSEALQPVGTAPPTDRDLMLSQPWTWAVMGKELIREGKVAPVRGTPGANQVRDARDHLYFEPTDGARDAIEGAALVRVRLKDGREVTSPLPSRGKMPIVPGRPAIGTAIPLPDGVSGDDVVAVVGPQGRVVALGQDFAPRIVATASE